MKNVLFLFFFLTLGIGVFAQQTVNGSIQHGGLTRTYILYVPASYTAGNPAPLVFNFHGYTSNANDQMWYGDFRSIADTAGFLVVHPQGTKDNSGTNHWNVGWGGSTVDDVDFTEKLIDSLSAIYSVDQDRVYSTGMSNGGFMSYQLACKLSGRIAAIASVTGAMTAGTTTSCNCSHPMPVMEIHGTADGTVSYNGTAWHSSVQQNLNFWSSFNNTSPFPTNTPVPNTATNDGCTAEHIIYPAGDNGATVEHFKVIGGAHTWPGAALTIGTTNQDFDASEEIWKFFSRHSLSTLTSGEEQHEAALGIEVFPNPTQDQLELRFPNAKMIGETLSLLDVNGKEVLRETIRSQESSLDLSALSPGTYLLKAGSYTEIVVVQ